MQKQIEHAYEDCHTKLVGASHLPSRVHIHTYAYTYTYTHTHTYTHTYTYTYTYAHTYNTTTFDMVQIGLFWSAKCIGTTMHIFDEESEYGIQKWPIPYQSCLIYHCLRG